MPQQPVLVLECPQKLLDVVWCDACYEHPAIESVVSSNYCAACFAAQAAEYGAYVEALKNGTH